MNLLNGSNYLIWLDDTTPITAQRGLNYRPIVCGTSNGFSANAESISLRNKDDGGFDDSTPGYISWGFDLDGFATGIKLGDMLSKANFETLADIFFQKKKVWIAQMDLEETIGRQGVCWIQDWKETANQNTPYSFSCQFVGTKKPIIESNIIKQLLATDSTGQTLVTDGNNNLIDTKNG